MTWESRPNTARAYGMAHRLARQRLLPEAYGKPCPICGKVMLEEHNLELDHVIPVSMGGAGGPVRMVHKWCNNRRGARMASNTRWQSKRSRW